MYTQLCSWDNLWRAFRHARKGKRGHPKVATFEHRLEDQLFQLQEELQSQSYLPGPYINFYIHEPKRRLISAAPFRDRVVHHALYQCIESLFEQSFIYDSYANRIGKGTHRALNRAQSFARRFSFVLPCDIRQYFPSIDHTILRDILVVKIQDEKMRWLIDRILESGRNLHSAEYQMVYFPGDDLFAVARPRGLPIGNLTSQFWANCYLNPIDHFVKRELGCKGYVRYVDDLLLFGQTKKDLWDWKQALEARLACLRLTLHPRSHPRPVTEGFPFLGFNIRPGVRRLKRRKGIYFQRRFRRNLEAYRKRELTFDQLTAFVQGWVNHVRYANTVGLRKALLTRPDHFAFGPRHQ